MTAHISPFVRVVVLSFDGGQMTIDCLESLLAVDWPADRMEIVLVDNGSLDDVADRVRAEYPHVRLLEPLENLGFAGGCNLGMRLDGVHDFIALVNNDATVDPGWLVPLVAAAQAAPDIGAVSSKMLLADQYLQVEVSVPGAAQINRNDARDLGVRVSAVRLDGVRADGRVTFDEGFYGAELPNIEYDEEIARWSLARGSIRVAIQADTPLPAVASLRLSSPAPREVTISTEAEELTLQIGPERTWFDIRLGKQPFDVINNVGSNLYPGGFGGDRGFLQRDVGQFETPTEVFAWCGGAVLLRRDYIDQVGLFDERLFLYYEDTDLSWRGRLQGWRYLYEPTSLVRHRHAASSVVGSPVFRFYTERNRLLMLAKNAPWPLALRAGLGEFRRFVRCTLSAYIIRPLRLQMPERNESAHRRRVFASYLRQLRPMLRDRRSATLRVERSALMSWVVDK